MDLCKQSIKIRKTAEEGVVLFGCLNEPVSRRVIGKLFLGLVLLICHAGCLDASITRVYNFTVKPLSVTRVCKTKSLVSVNGMYPGPTLYANTGDRILVNVTNSAQYNITIHWHGVRQLLSGWSDGPVYVTQCPLQTGQSYVYNFTLTNQSGTLLWHAHATWLRGTVYGAIVIFPGTSYPFKFPEEEHVIILGEWWNANVEEVESTALLSGGPPAVPDAYTINGWPGPLYNCSQKDVYVLKVFPQKTYLLRVINAALNTDLFFSVSKHNLTVVEVDGEYTKPYITDKIMLAPGQTTNVLLSTDQPAGRYYMWGSPYISAQNVSFQKTQTLALLEYKGSINAAAAPILSAFPVPNDTNSVTKFSTSLRSLADSVHQQISVPQTVDKSLYITVGLGVKPCDGNHICQGPNRTKFTASMNNVSLVMPDIAVLQAYFFNISGVFTRDFPDNPPFPFNYTGNPPANQTPDRGTKAVVLPFNSNVQIILQDTSIAGTESHPIHSHGYSFYIVGQGFGNYNPSNASSFNLVDPPKRNTVGVPVGGWAAIRFKADNPGIWLVHCHLEIHISWGLASLFLVPNGVGPGQSLPPPPPDLPKC